MISRRLPICTRLYFKAAGIDARLLQPQDEQSISGLLRAAGGDHSSRLPITSCMSEAERGAANSAYLMDDATARHRKETESCS